MNNKRNEHNYCVILAGGQGTRFWPVSRLGKPKQFLDFFGMGRTLLQQTFDRMSRFIDKENVYVVTQKEYVDLVREQLPVLSEEQVLPEPMRRNTAPAALWATLHIRLRDKAARVVFVPADQLITNELLFQEDILKTLDFVGENHVPVALGVTPNKPETSYGYIQKSEEQLDEFFKVQSFTEKPELNFAQFFVECGEFCWNTGIFLWSTQAIYNGLSGHIQALLNMADENKLREAPTQEKIAFLGQLYTMLPNLTLDSAVLEKTERVYVKECQFGWADVGNWDSFYHLSPKDDNENVVPNSNVVSYGARRNAIMVPEDKTVIVEGLDDFVVIDDDNLLVICPRGNAPMWRKYVNDAQMNLGEDFL